MVCKLCNKDKTQDFFYTCNKHICKECIKERVRKNRQDKIEYYREYDRNRPNREERIKQNKEYKQRLRLLNPEKYDKIFHGIRKKYRKTKHEQSYANGVVDDMLRYGKLERPKVCSICGVSCTPQAHHPDYSKPKEVIWVCTKCHANIHKQMRAEKRKLQSQASA